MSKGYLGIVLKDQSLSYVFMLRQKGRLKLSESGNLPYPESSAAFPFVSAVKTLFEQKKFDPEKIFVSFLRQDVLNHQLTLPKMPVSEIEEVILGEIEKLPAYSEREFEYVYSSHDLDERRVKVIFSAYFKEAVDELISCFRSLKYPLEAIELSPLNLLPALYSLEGGKEEALVVLEDKNTYVMVENRRCCCFFYATGSGIEDFSTAGTGQFNVLAFSNWTEELKRIFKSYAIEYKSRKMSRISLVWDKEKAPDLDLKLFNELNIEVLPLTIASLSGIKTEPEPEEQNPLLVLAAAPLISGYKKMPADVSYDPFVHKLRFKKVVMKIIAGALVYLAAASALVLPWFYTNLKNMNKLEQERKELSVLIRSAETEQAELKTVCNELISIRESLLAQASFVQMLNRVSWARIFSEVAADLPQGLDLTSFSVSSEGAVSLDGEALKVDSVAALMRMVEESEVLEKAQFDHLREQKQDEQIYFVFGITAVLSRDKEEREAQP